MFICRDGFYVKVKNIKSNMRFPVSKLGIEIPPYPTSDICTCTMCPISDCCHVSLKLKLSAPA